MPTKKKQKSPKGTATSEDQNITIAICGKCARAAVSVGLRRSDGGGGGETRDCSHSPEFGQKHGRSPRRTCEQATVGGGTTPQMPKKHLELLLTLAGQVCMIRACGVDVGQR